MIKKLWWIGLITGGLHVLILLLFYGYIHSDKAERSQVAFYWLIWLLVDFPVSLLSTSEAAIKVFKIILMTDSIDKIFLFLHGVLGTIWWIVLICGIYYLWQRFTTA